MDRRRSDKAMMKKPELLAPAGDLNRCKTAIRYGADAVYIGGQSYSLRSRASNFTMEDIKEACEFARQHNAHIHVTTNVIPHEEDYEGLREYLMKLEEYGVTAIIAASPSIMKLARECAPKLEIHCSTQMSITNVETAKFLHEQLGLDRAVLARECSIEDIYAITKDCPVDTEAFIHGGMCVNYSGRCTLSNRMTLRDANRGGCAQSCRWQYHVYQDDKELNTDVLYSMGSKDLLAADYMYELMDAGVSSLKIEGRMKSIHYVSTVSNVYRAAVDSYCEDPDNYVCKQEWIDELWKAAQRELATGFYYQVPTEHEQLFGPRRQIPQYAFVGQVLEYDPETQMATVQQRNNFKVGDQIEFYGPGMRHHEEVLTQLWDENGEEIEAAPHAMMICKMKVTEPVKPLDMIRKRR